MLLFLHDGYCHEWPRVIYIYIYNIYKRVYVVVCGVVCVSVCVSVCVRACVPCVCVCASRTRLEGGQVIKDTLIAIVTN